MPQLIVIQVVQDGIAGETGKEWALRVDRQFEVSSLHPEHRTTLLKQGEVSPQNYQEIKACLERAHLETLPDSQGERIINPSSVIIIYGSLVRRLYLPTGIAKESVKHEIDDQTRTPGEQRILRVAAKTIEVLENS